MPPRGLRSGICTASLSLALTLLAACGGGGGSGGGGSGGRGGDSCSTDGQVLRVESALEERYFWNDEPEQLDKYAGFNADAYADTDALLDFLRYRPDEFDRNFTYVTTIEEDSQFFGAGVFVGYGFSYRQDDNEDWLWITQVFVGSPADNAGFARGLRINKIDGRSVTEIIAADELDDAFGESDIGVTQTFELLDENGVATLTTATKAEVVIDPVPQFTTFHAGGKTIGYLEFRTFVSTASASLNEAFAHFQAASVTDLIVDVRYNGGGLVTIAEFFASLLAGPANVSAIMAFTRFNQSNSIQNQTALFSSEPNTIDLDSIVFITTESTASASELVINVLEPYLDVALVGARTFGKPVGQTATDFCAQRLRLVTFETLNVNEEGRYFDGLPVDCPAQDELERAVGDPLENSLSTALTWVTTGGCPSMANRSTSTLTAAAPLRRRPSGRGTPAREYANAE